MSGLATVRAFLPSPSSNAIHLGPFQLRAYGLLIAIGLVVSTRWAERRWVRGGGRPGEIGGIAIWAVQPELSVRLYHVITDYELYQHDLLGAFAIWDGGLGLAGGIAAMEGMRIDFAHTIIRLRVNAWMSSSSPPDPSFAERTEQFGDPAN